MRAFNMFTIYVSIVLSAWLLWCVGCFICVLITYRQFRQSVKMSAGSCGYLVVIIFSVLWMAISSALKMVCRPGSLLDI